MPVAAAVLPEAVAHGLSRASLDSVPWPALGFTAVAGLAIFALSARAPAAAFAATAGLAAASTVWVVFSTFPELDRVASARPWWREVSRGGSLPCVDDVHRSLRYGLFYYAGRELPSCSATRQRNHAILDRDPGDSR
jgi:hypothetical protein